MAEASTSGAPAEVAERLFTPAELSKLCGVSPGRLAQWRRSSMLPARLGPDGRPRYVFRDVVAARTAAALLGAGVKVARVREAVVALRAWRPEMHAPLASMRLFSEAGRLLVQLDGQVMEPISGQLLLALPEGELLTVSTRGAGGAPTPLPAASGAAQSVPLTLRPRTAQQAFEAGLAAETAGTHDEAEALYREALERDPVHPGALLNLGNLVYRRGELESALEAYRAALEVAEDFPEAHYNLGNVLDDLGRSEAAVGCYERALALDPEFKAAHFNLALAWEKLGQRARAAASWRAFLALEPEGESAAVARSFLADETAGA